MKRASSTSCVEAQFIDPRESVLKIKVPLCSLQLTIYNNVQR